MVRLATWANRQKRRRTERLLLRPHLGFHFPADSLLLGRMPTQEAIRSALPKAFLSPPISTLRMAVLMNSALDKVCSKASAMCALALLQARVEACDTRFACFDLPQKRVKDEAMARGRFGPARRQTVLHD